MMDARLAETRHKFLVIKCQVCSLSIPGGLFVDHFYTHRVAIQRQASNGRIRTISNKKEQTSS